MAGARCSSWNVSASSSGGSLPGPGAKVVGVPSDPGCGGEPLEPTLPSAKALTLDVAPGLA